MGPTERVGVSATANVVLPIAELRTWAALLAVSTPLGPLTAVRWLLALDDDVALRVIVYVYGADDEAVATTSSAGMFASWPK